MNQIEPDLKERLKQRLSSAIAFEIDGMAHVPADIVRLVGDYPLHLPPPGALADDGSLPAAGSDPGSLADRVTAFYDSFFFNKNAISALLSHESDYRNIGFWDGDVQDVGQAGRRLQDRLLDFIPEKTGRILDVACGMGASTRRLLDFYPAENIWAINISERQLENTRRNAPGAHVLCMNAVDLAFEDGYFDAIECIEAAFHFETRRKYLEEALRVLRPGGHLVMSDVLFTSRERLTQSPVFPSAENHLASAEEYRDLLKAVGFRDILVEDESERIWKAHFKFVVNQMHEAFLDGKINIVSLTEMMWLYYHLNVVTGPCLLIHARK